MSESKDLMKYGSFDLEEVDENEKELARGSSNFLKLGVGRTIVRVIPPKLGKKVFAIAHQHYIEIPGVQNKLNFNCPKMMAKKPCPACAKASALAASGNPLDRSKADKFWPRKRMFCNVINRSAPEIGVQVMAFGKQIAEQLNFIRKDQDIDFTDPIAGYDLIIRRTGTGQNDTEYKVAPAKAPSPLGDMDLIEQQGDLARYTIVPSQSELSKKMSGGDEEDEDLGDDDKIKYTAPKPTAARSAADDAIDAEVDDL